MGNYTSKFLASYQENDERTKENQFPATPPIKRNITIDPRSATVGIPRTPIEVICTPPASKRISAIPKYLQTKTYLETDIDNVMPPLPLETCLDPRSPNVDLPRTPILVDAVNAAPIKLKLPRLKLLTSPKKSNSDLQTLDPRSPAIDFTRTPILRLKPGESEESESSQDSPTCHLSQSKPKLAYCETTSTDFNVPELQVLPDIITSLEAQLNLDECASDSTDDDSNYASSTETIFDTEQVTVILNKNAKQYGINSANVESNEIKVWRDSVSPEIPLEVISENSEEFLGPKEEVIIEFDDNSVIKNLSSEDKQQNKKLIKKKPRRNVKSTSVDDKKLFSPDGKNSIEQQKNRTPLGNRSNNNGRSVLNKSPQQLRKKGLSKRFQENTPPSKRVGKSNKQLNALDWDPDNTVII